MNAKYVLVSLLAVAAPVWAASGAAAASTPATTSACHASLSAADARALAAATPNARAFAENYGATLQTAVSSQSAGIVNVAVTANDAQHGTTQVGVYTVSLRTGRVTDDDMEPAEDAQTSALRMKLMARHCFAR